MGNAKQQSIRFAPWMHTAIEELAAEKALTFTDVVNILLESELEYMGFSESQYNAKTFGLGRGSGRALDVEQDEAVIEKKIAT
jgi:hypothetical protein